MLGHRPLASAPLAGFLSVASATAAFAFVGAGSLAIVSTYNGQIVFPASDIAFGGWLPSAGNDLFAMVNETPVNDATYIYSPPNPTTQQFEVKLSTILDPASSAGHIGRLRLRANGDDTNFDFDVVQGATVLDSWTELVLLSAGWVTRSRTFSGAVADAITDGSDLRLRGVARA